MTISRFLVIAVLGAIIQGSISNNAYADIEIRIGAPTCLIVLSGKITQADAEELKPVKCLTASVVLDSPGGDANAAMEIGRWARERKVLAYVSETSICYSSCALVYIGAVARINRGQLGLHRPYLAGDPLSEPEVREVVADMYRQIRSYAEEMGISREFTNVMMNTPPSEVRVFHGQEISSIVPESDPVHEEVRIARSARIYGIPTDEYRRRHRKAVDSCDLNSFIGASSEESPMVLHDHCRKAIYWDLSQSIYERRAEEARATCEFLRPLDTSGLTPLSVNKQEDIERVKETYLQYCIAIMRGDAWPEAHER